MQSSATVEVDRVLEAAKLRGPALVVLFCAAASLILDGFDIQAVGFAAPALLGDLHVERAALGPALAASLTRSQRMCFRRSAEARGSASRSAQAGPAASQPRLAAACC